MKILTWAAVVVTALFVLMNLGAAFDAEQADWVRIVGGVLGALGIVAAGGLAAGRPWGRGAVIAVGAGNVAASIAGLADSQDGAAIGLVVGGLGVVLGALATDRRGTGAAPA